MDCAGIEQVAMHMWPPYIGSVEEHTEARIVFDKLYIVAHLNKAVDQVRRAEQRELLQAGDSRLKRSRYLWPMNRQRMAAKQRRTFAAASSGWRGPGQSRRWRGACGAP